MRSRPSSRPVPKASRARTSCGTSAALLAATLAAGGCTDQPGIVEVNWQFDDAALERIYPLGFEPDTCELDSLTVRYDLRVRLTVLENSETCISDPSQQGCTKVQELFECNRSRGTALEVEPTPDGEPGYMMIVEPMIDPTDAEPFVAAPSCIATPGPRVRKVRPGRLTDLEVYQFIVLALDHEDGQLLDIDSCRI